MFQLFTGGKVRRLIDTADDLFEAQDLAAGYVNDPRDTVEVVYLYDTRQGQYRGWVKRGDKIAKRQLRRAA